MMAPAPAPALTTPHRPVAPSGVSQAKKKTRRSFGTSVDGNTTLKRIRDVDMDTFTVVPAEAISSPPSSPALAKTLFAGGFGVGDSSTDDDYEDDSFGKENTSSTRRTSYRSRSRRLASVSHPARVAAPQVAYVSVTPMKASRVAARRRSSMGSSSHTSSTSSTSTKFDSPLPTERQRNPSTATKRLKIPFPGLYSPVPVAKSPLFTPCKTMTSNEGEGGAPDSSGSTSTSTSTGNRSVCSTMSSWSPWESPSGKQQPIDEVEPMLTTNAAVFKSPPPRTPHKQRTPTPSRQKFLGRNEVLVRVQYPSDSPGMTDTTTSFDELETVGWLGAGVTADVLKVFSSKRNRYYAVKKSKRELRSERERDMLLQEIVIAEHLAAAGGHFDHIVRYHQAWQHDGHLFVQMELCSSGNLREFISHCDERRIPEAYIWTIMNHLSKGLEVLHAHGIVHLDIKPENIFLTRDGVFKIGDFGMATETTNTPLTQNAIELEGDSVYMAKELLSTAERNPSADVFCLGIMMLEVATGIELPSSGDGWHALRDGQLPPLPADYSSELAAAITQMMHPDPSLRPTATAILSHAYVDASSAPAGLLIEYAQSYSVGVGKQAHHPSRPSFSETPRKPRLSLSLFNE